MASAGLWGAVPQSEAVAQDATRALEKKLEPIDSSTPNSGASSTDVGSGLDKERADQEVTQLARQITQHSIKISDGHYSNPFEASDDPALDPGSGKFNPEAWVRTLMG